MNVIVIGDMNCGKTSFVRHQCGEYVPTIGVDFVSYRSGKLKIWDTAGQERFHSIVSQYYRMSDICLIFYSCGDPETYASVKRWRAEVSLANPGRIYIVACKSDLGRLGEADFYISNKTGEGLDALHDLLRLSVDTESSPDLVPAQRNCCYQ